MVAKDEPLDPLELDIGEDEIEYEPEKLNMELDVNISRFCLI